MEAIANVLAALVTELAPATAALNEQEWRHIVSALELSPQQARIVELIMEGKGDKQIAGKMRVRVPTVRTYLTRIFQRTGAADRVGLVLRVFACAREMREQAGGNQK